MSIEDFTVKKNNNIDDLNMVPYDIKIKEYNIFLKEGEILKEREKLISEACENFF